MSREVTGWYELPDGTEVEAVMRYSTTPYRPATCYEPEEPAGIEIEELVVDGVAVDAGEARYARLVDELLERATARDRDDADAAVDEWYDRMREALGDKGLDL